MAKGRKTNKVAYSKMLKSYIKCVEFKTSTNWSYVLCDADGNVNVADSTIRKANTYYSMFSWKECV